MNTVVDDFYKNREFFEDKITAVRFHKDDRLKYDVDLVSRYLDKGKRLLDLGCGTGAMVDEFVDICKEIYAVDKYDFFVNRCVESAKVKKFVSDITDYRVNEKFDVIIIFGVMIYIIGDDIDRVYENCLSMLNEGGHLIIRNQFGVNEDVLIDKFSEELGRNYFAEYRYLGREVETLKKIGFSRIEVVDIYPKSMNKWSNTHNYVLICNK